MADSPTLAEWIETGIPVENRPDDEPASDDISGMDADAVGRALVEFERRFPPPDMEQVRADWLWVAEQTPTRAFDRYRGLSVAVRRQQVLGASDRPLHLQLELARRLNVHPEQLVMAHIEPSAFR